MIIPPRGSSRRSRVRGHCGQNSAVGRFGDTVENPNIRAPLQSLRDSFPPGDAFEYHTCLTIKTIFDIIEM